MYNLIKMDLYRLFRSTSTYVMIVLVAFFGCFTVWQVSVDLNLMADAPPVAEQEDAGDLVDSVIEEKENGVDLEFGIYTDTDARWIHGDIDAADLIAMLLGCKLLLVFVSVFVTLFVMAEQKNGYVKNIAGQFHNRGVLVLSKLAALAVQILLMFAAYTIAILSAGRLFWGGRFVLHSLSELAMQLGLQYLLHLAFACLILILCTLAKSSALSITVGILLSCGVGALFYEAADRLIAHGFRLEKYVIEGNILAVGTNAAMYAKRALACGAVAVLVSALLTFLITQKRDIR